jgi:phage terminase small subunit
MAKALSNHSHELFAQARAAGATQVQAYKDAGYPPATAKGKAHRIASREDVMQRVAEIQANHSTRHNITVDSLIDELEEARAIGEQEGQAGSMVSATMGKAKLLGYIDKHEQATEKTVVMMGDTEMARRLAFMLRLGMPDSSGTIEHDAT